MDDIWSGSDLPFLFENADHSSNDVLVSINCNVNKDFLNNTDFLTNGFVYRAVSLHEEKAFEGGQFTLWFFERQFVDKSLFVSEERGIIFKCVRSSIFRLMRLASHGFQVTTHEDSSITKLRKEITRVLHYCNNSINRFNFPAEAPSSELDDIVNDFKSLSTSVGTLSQLVNTYSLRKVQKDVLIHALFHITLELNVHYVLLLFQLVNKYPDNSLYQTTFTQISQAMVDGLVSLANMVYKQGKGSSKSLWKEDCHHVCSCVKQVWVVLIHTIDALSKKFTIQSFWSVVSTVLQNNQDINSSQLVTGAGGHDSVEEYCAEFKVWLLCGIAPLYWIDTLGKNNFSEKSSVPRNWQTVQELIQHSLTANSRVECVDSLVWSCLSLTKHWGVQLNVFCMLWDYFNKDMNNNVRKGNPQTLNSFVKTVHSPSVQFDSCVAYTAEVASLNESDTPFDLFLRYLVVVVKRLKLGNEVQVLSQVKGRIYSKFHKRRMDELNTNGLDKFGTLFTVMSLIFNVDEIPKKMCSLISLLQFNQKQLNIKKQIILNLFVCLVTCKNQKLPVAETVVQKIIDLFGNLVALLWDSKKKKEQYTECWDLVCYYLDCVEQSFDYNIAIPDEASLLCPTYTRLLKISPDNQKKRIYMHFKCILSSSYLQQKPLCGNVYDLIWKNIYFPLGDVTIKDNNTGHVADIFAGVTILSSESELSEGDENFQTLINKYAFSEDCSIVFKCSYISHILSSPSAVQKLVSLEKTNHIIKIWIACVIQELYTVPTVLELTRSLINSRRILKWLPQRECNHTEDVKNIMHHFVSHLGKTFASMQTLNEMSEFRKTINIYFSDFTKIAGGIILNSTCEKTVALVFQVGGLLALHCAKPIYSKTSPTCLLPQLLDLFVLPFSSSKKPLSPLVMRMVKEHIHMFLCGLASLDCKKDDFVARKVKEVLKKYFIEFSTKSAQDAKKNPLLISLHASCMENPVKTASDYRHLVLEYIREHCLCLPQPPEQLVSVLTFILELLQSTLCSEETMHTMKLLAMKMVSCILVCDAVREKGEPRGVRNLAMTILRKMVGQSSNESSRETFKALLYKFICDNLPHYQGTLLKTLQCICLVSSVVMTALLPEIEKLVAEQEKKRGVGVDGALRESLHDLKSFVTNAT